MEYYFFRWEQGHWVFMLNRRRWKYRVGKWRREVKSERTDIKNERKNGRKEVRMKDRLIDRFGGISKLSRQIIFIQRNQQNSGHKHALSESSIEKADVYITAINNSENLNPKILKNIYQKSWKMIWESMANSISEIYSYILSNICLQLH